MERTRRGRSVWFATMIVLVTTSGCSLPSSDPFSGPAKSHVVIEVDNRSFNRATIWILSSAGVRRLGMVDGKLMKAFTIPWRRSDDMRFRVRILGERGFTTNPKLVAPGDHVELQIT